MPPKKRLPFIRPASRRVDGVVFRKRSGRKKMTESQAIEKVVAMNLGKVSSTEVTTLAQKLHRREDTMKRWVQDAKEKFLKNASRYVEIHHQAVEDALAAGSEDPKYLEVATRGAQWAIERLRVGNEGVVEQEKTGPSEGLKVLIGVKVGGLNEVSTE